MATLLSRLMARPSDDLERLAQHWGVRLPGRSHPEDVATLYRTMTDTWALRDVLASLAPEAARLLWQIVRAGALPDTSPPPAAAVVDELRAKGLLHLQSPGIPGLEPSAVLADETAALCRRLADERQQSNRHQLPLADLIASLDGGDMAAAAERWGVEFVPGSQPRDEVERLLLQAVSAPDALDHALSALERPARQVYDLLAAQNAPLGLVGLRQRTGLSRLALRRAIRHLNSWLLVWEVWLQRERHFFVPSELRPWQRGAAVTTLAPISAEADDWRHPQAAAWDLLAWLRWRMLQPRNTAPTPGGHRLGAPPAHLLLWHAATRAERQRYVRFLAAAAHAVGVDETADVSKWVAQPFSEQQAALVSAWRSGALRWAADAGHRTDPLAATAALREGVAASLAQIEPSEWYSLEALVAVAMRTLGALPSATTARRSTESTTQDARAVHRQVVSILRADLVWLGVLDAGREVAQQRPALRLTPWGAWLLAGRERPADPVASIIVEPTLRVLVYAATPDLLWRLHAMATPLQLDRVAVFQLSRHSVATALTDGLTPSTLLGTLEKAARHPVPQNVAYALHDWARTARHVRLHRALVLAFDDDVARDRALNLQSLRALDAEPLSRHRLIITVDDAAAEAHAIAELRRLGLDTRQKAGPASS